MFFFFSCLAGLFMIWISKDYGITWDEWEESNYGSFLLRYFLSGARDLGYLEWKAFLFYGEPVFMIAGVLFGLLHGPLLDFVQQGLRVDTHLLSFYLMAHGIDAAFGFVAMLFAGLLAKELGNWKTALLTFVFLFLSPRFFGNSMNDHKDIPFAAMYVFSFYFMLRWVKALPCPPKSLSLGLILGIAAAIWTRVGALVLIPYLFLFSFGYSLILQRNSKTPVSWWRIGQLTLTVAFLGYLGGLLLWPYAQMDPLTHPFQALLKFSNYTHSDDFIFFEGQLIQASKLPWYYLPKWILISNPLFFISGLCFLSLFALQVFGKGRRFFASLVAFGACFPLLYIMVQRSSVFDSWRHVLFIYPLLIVLLSLAWQEAWAWATRSKMRILLGIFFAVQLTEPAAWMIRNHPNEYVYFNPLVGGLKGAFLQYETDYWGNSLRKGAEWLANHQAQEGFNGPIQVRSDGTLMSSYPFLQKKLGGLYYPFAYPEDFLRRKQCFFLIYPPLYLTQIAYQQPWDYALALSKKWPAAELKTKWPPPGTIHEVKADGVTLCAVVKNPLKK